MWLGNSKMSYLSSTNLCVKFKLQVRAREHLVLWRIQDRTPADRKDQAKEDTCNQLIHSGFGNGKRSVLFSLLLFLFLLNRRGGGWESRGRLGGLSGW